MKGEIGALSSRRQFIKGALAGIVLGATETLLPGAEEDTSARKRLTTGFVYNDIYLKHDPGAWHPEKPERLQAIVSNLRQKKMLSKLSRLEVRKAELRWVQLVHTKQYVELVQSEVEEEQLTCLSTGDTNVCADSYQVALWAVGGTLAAVDAVVSGKVNSAFCALRPPGHHAGPAKGMGFCIFNNAAIAARYAQKKHDIGKVLIVDWDVHHGNGTQEAFYTDSTVFYFSTHQSPWYPGTGPAHETGTGKGAGTNLNVPMPAGTDDKAVISAFTDKLIPAVKKFKPELVIISAGFDSRTGDPLGRFEITDDGFRRLTKMVRSIAKESAADRIVSVLEGGYDLEGLASASQAHIAALMGDV